MFLSELHESCYGDGQEERLPQENAVWFYLVMPMAGNGGFLTG